MKKLQNNNFIIQIQHLLKLNFSSWTPDNGYPSIQIQHLLKLNVVQICNGGNWYAIQIQHLLKLNMVIVLVVYSLINSNTTLVKVKF